MAIDKNKKMKYLFDSLGQDSKRNLCNLVCQAIFGKTFSLTKKNL